MAYRLATATAEDSIRPSDRARPSTERAGFEELASQMLERERWPRERLQRYQQLRLRKIVRHAAQHSPYYRLAIGKVHGEDIALNRLPVLDKATLVAEFDRIVTDRRVRLADAERHLASEHAAELFHGAYQVVGSGGTTGQRSVVVYDPPAWEVAVAGLVRALRTQGITAGTRVLGIGAPTPLHMTNRLFAALGGARKDAPRVAVTTPLPEMVDALNADRPEAIITYPSVIRPLADEQKAGRLRISPRKFCSVAETLTPDVRQLAGDAWGATVLNTYGATEVNLIAVECPSARGLHVAEDLVVVEVVDEDNRPVPPGVTGQKVLVTTLFNRSMPFIRYELSDLVAVAEGVCPCGRPHLRLESIQGRQQDVLRLSARGGGQVAVNAFLLGETLLHVPAIRQYQLTPRPDGLLVRVVLRDSAAAAEALAAARRSLVAELGRVGAVPDRLIVEPVPEIARSGGGAKANIVSTRIDHCREGDRHGHRLQFQADSKGAPPSRL